MEKDFGSWFYNQHTDWQSPNLNSLSDPVDSGQHKDIPAYMIPANMVSTNETLPAFEFSGVPHSKASQPNWFYCVPRFRQAFPLAPSTTQKEKLPPAGLNANCGGGGAPIAGSGSQKKFLVFDQSGDQTIIFSSGIGAPIECVPSWRSPTPIRAFDLNKEYPETKILDAIYPSGPFSIDGCTKDNEKNDVQSEMHEDTEELNALLYSEDENECSEDDEVTSTGHSPSTMTAYDKREQFEESGEEVASSGGPAKRQKLSNGGHYEVPSSLMDTARSVKTARCFRCEDDAESSSGDSKSQVFGESGSLSGNKRSLKEKIRDTVSILQTIIPGGKDKDAVVVIDEALEYLRSLKVRAQAFGLDTY